jgi:2-methylcitrate dehydratase PrpD
MAPHAVNGNGENASLIRLAVRRLGTIASTELPKEVTQKVNLAILDYLGSVAAGLKAPWAESAIQYARMQEGKPQAHGWGLKEETSCKTAAYLNAVLAHRYFHCAIRFKAVKLTASNSNP